jgi:hypothetical protein
MCCPYISEEEDSLQGASSAAGWRLAGSELRADGATAGRVRAEVWKDGELFVRGQE